jgi:hypothetical protein
VIGSSATRPPPAGDAATTAGAAARGRRLVGGAASRTGMASTSLSALYAARSSSTRSLRRSSARVACSANSIACSAAAAAHPGLSRDSACLPPDRHRSRPLSPFRCASSSSARVPPRRSDPARLRGESVSATGRRPLPHVVRLRWRAAQ